MSGILAAVLAAVAFTAMKFVPKTEPTVVLAMSYHTSAVAMSAVPLAVRPVPALQGHACVHGGLVARLSRHYTCALMDDTARRVCYLPRVSAIALCACVLGNK